MSVRSPMTKRKPLKKRVSYRIARRRSDVFVRSDFADLGGYDQIGRCLRQLVRERRLIRLGYGVYARAKQSSITGKPMLAAKGGFVDAARQALDRLKVLNRQFKGWEPTLAELNYNTGRSTQVPTNAAVKIKGRFSRKLSYGSMELFRAA